MEATNDKSEPQAEDQGQPPDKKPKLKYVPGPIGALIDQADVVGLHLTINQQDELEPEEKEEAQSPS